MYPRQGHVYNQGEVVSPDEHERVVLAAAMTQFTYTRMRVILAVSSYDDFA